MAGREVREYTNLTDPKDKKSGKGKDKIDDEEITFQRMVAKWDVGVRIIKGRLGTVVCLSVWDLGLIDMYRCKRLLENVEATFMDEAVLSFVKFKYAALDSDDLLYLKEQMEAEEDAERLLRRTEKRAFAAFKISFCFCGIIRGLRSCPSYIFLTTNYKAVAETSPASVPLPLRVEPKPKSGIRQQDLLKRVVAVKPKRQRVLSPSDGDPSSVTSSEEASKEYESMSGPRGTVTQTDQNSDPEEKVQSSSRFSQVQEVKSVDNPVQSLFAAYESSDDED
ncbi:hypothetical protein BUALT_Bualt07G0001300 [Buddleja alternifolia]|uniref:Uncharacterized protein n=1 Tax=Buddleja alternifolia TaxID=168488 RepID=A0AAV6XER3_9LAMI|nr:hypothetical protein BUALT_Bualt07G0001300 [Buddleja alternifolia]